MPVVDSIITSPPYWNVTDYHCGRDQVGHGQTLRQYLIAMGDVFSGCAALSKPNATMCLVVGAIRRKGEVVQLPSLLVDEANASGWRLREQITWDKQKDLPWTKHGEFRDVTEQVLLLSRTTNYTFNVEDLLSPTPQSEWWVRYPERYSPRGRMPTNIWRIPIPTQGAWRSCPRHACPFPEELSFRLVAMNSNLDDVIFDPFAGIGSVPAMATVLGRRGYGLDLSSGYVAEYGDVLDRATTWVAEKSAE
jgi:DNA modification methylase